MSEADNFQRCPNCREFGFLSGTVLRHRCAPEWECRGDWQTDEDWDKTFAHSADTAAEKFAERYDASGGEYAIVSGMRDCIVLVRKPGDCSSVERYAIAAETVPSYRAEKADA
jgi:hypothetical protein